MSISQHNGKEERGASELTPRPRTPCVRIAGTAEMTAVGALLAFALPLAHRPQHDYQSHHQRRLQQFQYQQEKQQHRSRYRRCLPAQLRAAKLSVCTHQDCVQQGAYQTLAKLKKEAKRKDIKVDSCPCLGMCGLGPCVSIDWEGSKMEPRGGIDDDAAVRQIVEDASKPPTFKASTTQERDPYAEQ